MSPVRSMSKEAADAVIHEEAKLYPTQDFEDDVAQDDELQPAPPIKPPAPRHVVTVFRGRKPILFTTDGQLVEPPAEQPSETLPFLLQDELADAA